MTIQFSRSFQLPGLGLLSNREDILLQGVQPSPEHLVALSPHGQIRIPQILSQGESGSRLQRPLAIGFLVNWDETSLVSLNSPLKNTKPSQLSHYI